MKKRVQFLIYTFKFIAINNFSPICNVKSVFDHFVSNVKEKNLVHVEHDVWWLFSGFQLVFFIFFHHCERRPRALQENAKKLMKERKTQMLGSETNTSTNSHYFFPPSHSNCPIACGSCFRFILSSVRCTLTNETKT